MRIYILLAFILVSLSLAADAEAAGCGRSGRAVGSARRVAARAVIAPVRLVGRLFGRR